MKRAAVLLLMSIFCVFSLIASANDNIEADKAAIKQAALDYLEGWYSGDAARMDQALHPDLSKSGINILDDTGKTFLRHVTKSNMVTLVEAGVGKKPQEQWKNDIVILDVCQNMASVKAVSSEFIDYLLLAKCEGKWLIVKALWIPNK